MKVGFAKKEITPSVPMRMAGFDRRKGCSCGILDDLEVTVLALQDTKECLFLLCSFDVLGTDSHFCEQVKTAIAEKLRIDSDRIWVCATHTHSGPSHIYYGGATYDLEFAAYLLVQATLTAVEAVGDLQTATPEIAETQVTGVASLRNKGRSGAEYPMPLHLTKLCRKNDEIICCLFACHPTVLDESNTFFSKDIPGAVASCCPEKMIFLNGACADVSTRFTRRCSTPEELHRLGAIMAKSISGASFVADANFGKEVLTTHRIILLSRGAGVNGAERIDLLEKLREKSHRCGDPQVCREYESRIAVLERVPAAAEKDRRIHIAAVNFGAYIMLSLPFELDCDDGAELEEMLGSLAEKPVFVVCYAGGYDGYLPSGKPLSEESSYEDIASRYLPQSRREVWECAKQCVLEVK